MIANKCLLRRSDRATAVGCFVKQALVDNEGVAPHRVEVIHNGIDAARFDPGELARHMNLLLLDPALRQSMGDTGRDQALEMFTQQRMHDRFARIYDQLLR